MKVLIAAGGTGGHLYPGIALAREFERQEKDTEILFVGTSRGLEHRVLEREGFALRIIRVEGMIGRKIIQVLRTFALLPVSLADAYRILADFRPHLVIGIGGYASGPILLMAGFFPSQRVILEPNAIAGWTNRILCRLGRVNLVVAAFEEARSYLKRAKRLKVIGNPVRRSLVSTGPPADHPSATLLVLGGSQGAHSINLAMTQALEILRQKKPDLYVIHQTGERDYEMVRRAYEECGVKGRVEPYLYDMAEAYQQADLVLSRAGATTLAELTALGKPCILVPYPHATHRHQYRNAMAMASAGAALVLEDHHLSGPVVADQVLGLFGDAQRLQLMSQKSRAQGNPNATEEIVRQCIELIES